MTKSSNGFETPFTHHAEERREHEDAIRRLETECKRLDDRIHAMYADKLDALIDAAFFQKMSNQWREE